MKNPALPRAERHRFAGAVKGRSHARDELLDTDPSSRGPLQCRYSRCVSPLARGPKDDTEAASACAIRVYRPRRELTDDCRAGQGLRTMYDVLFRAGDCGTEKIRRPVVRQLLPRRRLHNLQRPPAGLPRVRVRMADPPRSFPSIEAGSGGHNPHGGPGYRRIPGRLCAGKPMAWRHPKFLPILWRSQNLAALWSPRLASCPGEFLALANGARRCDRAADFFIDLHKKKATQGC